MFWVLKRTVSMRLFLWAHKTPVWIDRWEGGMTFLRSKSLLNWTYELLDSILALSINITQIMMRVASLDTYVNRCTCLTVVSLEQVNKRVHTLRKLWWSDDNRLSTLKIQHIELFHIQWRHFDRCMRPNNNYGHMETGPRLSLIWQTSETGIQPATPGLSATPRQLLDVWVDV